MSTPRRPLTLVLAIAASAIFASPAYAQSEADKATARELGVQGQQALDGRHWAEAEDRFRRADALFHAPTLTLGLARAQARGGKVVEAWENYHRVIVENVTSPPAFARALQDAKAEITAVEGRRARLTLTVTGTSTPRVTLNDAPLRVEALGVARFVDPGHIVIVVAADGFTTATRAVDVGEGKDQALTIALERVAPAAVAVVPPPVAGAPPSPSPPPPASPAAPAPAAHGSPLRSAGIGALVVGGAGLILGGVTGGLALSDHSTLAGECKPSCTTSGAQSDLSGYHTVSTLSTVGFVVGAVGVAGGITMLVLAPKSDGAPAPTATIAPYLTLGGLGATGTF
jgi:hypothetical protein